MALIELVKQLLGVRTSCRLQSTSKPTQVKEALRLEKGWFIHTPNPTQVANYPHQASQRHRTLKVQLQTKMGEGFQIPNLKTKPSFYKNCKKYMSKSHPKTCIYLKQLQKPLLSMKQITQGMFLLFHCSLVLFYFNKVAQLSLNLHQQSKASIFSFFYFPCQR